MARLRPGLSALAAHLSLFAVFYFFRRAPRGGHSKAGEVRGRDYFPYRPPHLLRQPSRRALARLTNEVQRVLASGDYAGGLWLEGSPYVEETAWWLDLLIDTTWPVAACASQRVHGSVGNDGDRDIIDAVRYLSSDVWADEQGRDALGAVVVMDQLLMAARSVQKGEARPGGYVTTGGHGGVLGSISAVGRPVVSMRPVHRHTWSSAVRLSQLPEVVPGVRRDPHGAIVLLPVRVRDAAGDLEPGAIPMVALVKHGQYGDEDDVVDMGAEVAILARLERALAQEPLTGFVAEGSSPFATLNEAAEAALRLAVFSGLPVVKVGRGNAGGWTESIYSPFGIAGGNLTATKARLLLMACLLRFGALPPAADPAHPTGQEIGATQAALDSYREVFATH
jgi:L-asparaginase